MATGYQIRPISAREYHEMGNAGIIGPDERVELLDGALIAMPPIGPDHAYAVRKLHELMLAHVADRAIIFARSPLSLDTHSEPEPDVFLVSLDEDDYRTKLPEPRDVLLVVEVAKSSWAYDRGPKLRAYARAGCCVSADLKARRIARSGPSNARKASHHWHFHRKRSRSLRSFHSDCWLRTDRLRDGSSLETKRTSRGGILC
jgi:hypothetical protein